MVAWKNQANSSLWWPIKLFIGPLNTSYQHIFIKCKHTLNHHIGNRHSYCEDSLNDFVDSLIDSDNFDDLVNSGSGPVASGPVYWATGWRSNRPGQSSGYGDPHQPDHLVTESGAGLSPVYQTRVMRTTRVCCSSARFCHCHTSWSLCDPPEIKKKEIKCKNICSCIFICIQSLVSLSPIQIVFNLFLFRHSYVGFLPHQSGYHRSPTMCITIKHTARKPQ